MNGAYVPIDSGLGRAIEPTRVEKAPRHVARRGACGANGPDPSLDRPLHLRGVRNRVLASPAFVVDAARGIASRGDGQEAVHAW